MRVTEDDIAYFHEHEGERKMVFGVLLARALQQYFNLSVIIFPLCDIKPVARWKQYDDEDNLYAFERHTCVGTVDATKTSDDSLQDGVQIRALIDLVRKNDVRSTEVAVMQIWLYQGGETKRRIVLGSPIDRIVWFDHTAQRLQPHDPPKSMKFQIEYDLELH